MESGARWGTPLGGVRTAHSVFGRRGVDVWGTGTGRQLGVVRRVPFSPRQFWCLREIEAKPLAKSEDRVGAM